MKKFRMLLAVLLIVMFTVPFASAEALPVIGKLYVKAGATVLLVVPTEDSLKMIEAIAYGDAIFYINKVMKGVNEKTVYMAYDQPFVHDCPAHGAEPIDFPGMMIVMPGVAFDKDGISADGKVLLELF